MKSTPKLAKKAQYAVPMILIGMIALMTIYMILVYPEEKARMLGIDIPNETASSPVSSPLGEGTKLLFSSGEISEVGSSFGETVFSFNMDNVYVSYPPVEKVLDSQNLNMKANIFSGSSATFTADNLNLDNTKNLIVRLNISHVEGSPMLSILLNNTKIFERTLSAGELNINIPNSLLNENNPLKLKLDHTGAFWTSNKATLNAKIVQVYFNPKHPTASQVVTLGQSNIQGNEIKLSFLPVNVTADGEIVVKINGNVAFSGIVEAGKTFTISKRFDKSGIQIGDNTFEFEALKGGVYNLTNVKLDFVAVATPASKKVYSFDLQGSDLNSSGKVILGIKVDKIIKPGFIYAQIGNGGPLYYFNNADLSSGAWTYAELDKSYLSELGNKIIVDSPTGRYRVTGLVLILS